MEHSDNFKRIVFLVIGAVLLLWGLNNYHIIFGVLSVLWGYVFPFVLGICIAFLMNIPMRFFEKKLTALLVKMKKQPKLKIIRPISLAAVALLFIAAVFGIVIIAVPQIAETFSSLAEQIPEFFKSFQQFIQNISDEMPNVSNILRQFSIDLGNISARLYSFLGSFGQKALSSSFSLATSVFSGIVNFGLALIFAFYILMSKETLCSQISRTSKALLSENHYEKAYDLMSLINSTFSSFFSGQFLAAICSGVLFFIGMSIFRFPYAALISVMIAVAALIPIVGAFFAFVIATFLILVQSPIRALWFILFFFCVQQIDGNFIYPRVVGTSVGLPSIWVLLAITLGGSIMGVLGVIIFIPLVSVLYTLFRQFINELCQEKGVGKQ